jgi:cobalamin biosynthesis protein CobD/CbiB
MSFEKNRDAKKIDALTESFMLEKEDQSSQFWGYSLLICLVVVVALTLITVLLNKDFGYTPHIAGALTILTYFLHIQYVYHHMIDPVKKCVVRYSGRRDNLKPTIALWFRDIHCIVIDRRVAQSQNRSRVYFVLVTVDKSGKKFSLCTSDAKDAEIVEKGDFYASVFNVPFVNTETSFGCKITRDSYGKIKVIASEPEDLSKSSQVLTYVVLFLAIVLCVGSFFIR